MKHTRGTRLLSMLLTLAMLLSLVPSLSLTAFAAPTCPNPGCGSTNVEPFGNFENEWECQDCGYIFGASFGGDEDDITFTKVTDASQITAENIGTCAAEDAKSWAIANWDDLLKDSFFAEIAFYSNTGELYFVQLYSGLREEDLSTYFDNLVDTASISNLQEWFADGHSVFICTPAAPAEDGPLVGTVIKVGDTLTLDGDYIEVMPGVIDQATDSYKLERMEYDDYFNGWGAVFEGAAFLIAGDGTPEPDGFYISGGNGTQSHPYTIALHYASAATASFTKVTDASQITAENIGTCTAEEAKAWILANWDDVNENEVTNIAFYSNTGELNIVLFYAMEEEEFLDAFDGLINTDSSISELQDWFDAGDSVFLCTPAAPVTEWHIGDPINLGGKYYINDDQGAPSSYGFDRDVIVSEPVYETMYNQWIFENVIASNASEAYALYISLPTGKTASDVPTGFKVKSGDGTQGSPYTFELVYAEAVSFGKVTSADQITAENIEVCTFDDAKAWVLDNWDAIIADAGDVFAVEFAYTVNGNLRTIGFAPNITKDDFQDNITEVSCDINTLLLDYTLGGFPIYLCGFEGAATAYAGLKNTTTVVHFDGKDWYLIEDNSTSETEGTVTLLAKECVGASIFGGSSTYSGSTVEGVVNNYYTNSISTDAKTVVSGNGMFLLTTDQANAIKTANVDVLKCSKATGAESILWWLGSPYDPYNAACVYGDNGSIRDSGEYVERTIGVRPALQLDLSKVEFDSETKTFAVPTPTHAHGDLTFTAWESTNSLPTEAGNYYLTGDVKLDNTWFAPNGTTNLCLDGHSIGCAEGMPIQPICVDGEGTTLKLYDKDDNSGTITGALSTAGGVDVRNGGTFHMYGGTVTGNTSTDHGGGVRVRNNATFYLYGGSIENNKTQNMGGYGGGVHVETDSSFYMSGGSIQNNTAFAAAGVYIGTNCAFYMSGGSITGNIATNGESGVLFTNDGTATFKLSGDVTISDNVTKIDIEEIGVHETYPSNMVIPDSVTIEVVDALTGEGKIYVQIGTSRVFTNSTGSVKAKDYIDKFVSDSATYRIRTEGDELKIEAPYLRVGGTFVYDDNAADVFKDGKVKFTPANEITTYATLTLNGYQYDGTADDGSEGIVYLDSAQLRIVLQGENIVKATNPGIMINREADTIISSENGGSLEVVSKNGDAIYANGALTVESGTISATGGNRGIAANGIHLNGGKIVATGTGERGYGIYCDNLPWLPANSVGINSGISSLVASGTLGAVYGNATNALEGFGWSNAEGTEGREAIAVTAEARSLEYKKVAFVSHTHGFTYSASGATITATCANADGGCMLTDNKATLTIAAPDNLTYDKSAKAAVITDANAIQGTAKVQYQTKSGDAYGEATETAPTNAGTYKASITVGGATASVEYTIAKADPTCTAPTGLTATYGQTLADVTLTNPSGNTAGTWAWADSTQSVGNVVSPAATFKANFTPTSSNYKTVENVDVAVTVNKANQTAPAAPTKADATVDSITLTAITNGEYKCGAGDWQTSPTFTGLAQNTSYTFRQRYAADANHNASAGSEETVIRTNNHSHEWSFSATGATITATCTGTGTCSLTNNQISVTLVAPAGNPNLVYDGSDHAATLDGAEAFNAATGMNVSAADIVYNYKATSSESSAVVTETKNAGIYQALYTLQTPTSPKPFVGIQFTIGKADPVATAPTASATYGQTLGDVTLTNPVGNTAGTWTWAVDTTTSVGNAGNNTFTANFTPDDTTNYNSVENVNVTVTVGKATPEYTVPTGLAATYGDLLSTVTLPTGWTWTNGAQTVGNVGANTFTAIFTPADTANYNTVSGVNVTVTVSKATPAYTVPTGLTATYSDLLSTVALPTGWAWTNGTQSVGNAGNNTFTANFTPADTANYNTVSGVNVTVTVSKATPAYTVPTGLTATYGDTLSSVALPTGWAWANGAQNVGNAGANTFTANYTPEDTANYNTVSNVNVTVTVGKAAPTATAPTASATYGQTLGDVTLTNPNGNTPGTWVWAVDTTTSVGNAGSNTFTANFTPTDTDNYNTVSNVNVTVTVGKAAPTATAPAATATYGQTLADVTLTNPVGNTAGTWEWTADTATSVGNAGNNTFTANFTPTDTENYNSVTGVNVTVTVNKKDVTITANSASKAYDGTALTDSGSTNTELVSGDSIFSVTVTGTQKYVGSSSNVASAAVIKNGETDVTDNYNITYVPGTLTITNRNDTEPDKKYEITVTANSDTVTYDGKAHTVSGFETLEYTVGGVTYTVSGLSAETTETNAGTYTVAVTGTAVVKDAADHDLTAQFIVNTVDGTLTINKTEISGAIVGMEAAAYGEAVSAPAIVSDGETGSNGDTVGADATKQVTYYYQDTAFLKSQTDDISTLDTAEGVYKTITPTTFEPGTHYVLAVITGGNYNNVPYVTQSAFEITQNTETVRTAPEAPAVDGTKITVAEADREKSLEYSLDGQTWLPAELNENGEFTAEWANPVNNAALLLRETADECYAKPSASATGTNAITTETFTVTYDANGGVNAPEAKTVTGDRAVTVPGKASMIRAGYTFTEWNTKADGSGETYKQNDQLSKGTTLYAQWEKNEYTVRFNANGGEGTVEEQKYTYDSAYVLPENAFSRDGYTFLGWSNSGSGSVMYQDKQNVKNLAESGTVTLYAVWAKDLYNVSGTITSAHTGAITLQLVQGNNVFGETAVAYNTENAEVPFTLNGVPAGTYNLVATQGDVTMTAAVNITDDNVALELIKMPTGSVSSVIEVKGVETPAIVVGGLDELAKKEEVEDRKVTVTITVETQDEAAAGEAGEAIIKESRAQNADFMEFTVTKTISNKGVEESVELMGETKDILEFIIPFDFSGKTGIKLYRYHDGAVQELKPIENNVIEDGTYKLDRQSGLIYVYTSSFSTYAIAYNSNYSSAGAGTVAAFTNVIAATTNGKISVNPTAAKNGEKVIVTATPDEGYAVKTVTVTGANGSAISVTENADGTYSFSQPNEVVTVRAEFGQIDAAESAGFVDVPKNSYYADAVNWAVEKGVTTGTDATHFSPNKECTRAQMVTFLWRAAGSPEPTAAAAFTDVKADAYYAKAVAWAAENEITKGTSEETFSPDATVTRGQTVTFLFRALKGEAGGENPFTDVAEGAFYADAVKWAVAKNITTGTSATTFSPEADCTRAQIVTFLYRAYAEK